MEQVQSFSNARVQRSVEHISTDAGDVFTVDVFETTVVVQGAATDLLDDDMLVADPELVARTRIKTKTIGILDYFESLEVFFHLLGDAFQELLCQHFPYFPHSSPRRLSSMPLERLKSKNYFILTSSFSGLHHRQNQIQIPLNLAILAQARAM